MRKLGFKEEADFCKVVREWYSAEDDAGVPSAERFEACLRFRDYLLARVDVMRFPPHGAYMGPGGMTKRLFEGLLQNIEGHIQLYALVGSAYNRRAPQTLVNEAFNSQLAQQDPTNLGCPKATAIGKLLADTTELQHYRHNPERCFAHGWLRGAHITCS